MFPTSFPGRHRLLCLALAAALPAIAQTVPPGAGETLRELRQQPAAPVARGTATLVVPADTDTTADTGQKFPVRTIRISGNEQIATAELQPLVDGAAGRDVSLGELRQAAARVTAFYRDRGYVVARAFVPAQSLDDGSVRIDVLEGRLEASAIDNQSIVRTEVLQATLAAQGLDGEVVRSDRTDRALLLLADLPGAGAVSGQLRPGNAVGTSGLDVVVAPGKAIEGDVALDTYGNRYTGQDRLSGHLAFNSPSGRGDRLDLRATVTDQSLLYGRAAYDIAAGGSGLRLGAALSSSSYELGHEFAGLDAHGTANTVGANGTYPLWRSLNGNAWLAGALDHRALKDEVRSTDTTTKKNATAATGEAYGDWSDAFGGGGFSTWHVSGVIGTLHVNGAAADLDAAGPRTAGRYQKLVLSGTRLQALTPTTSLFASASAQAASKNLDSSEKFAIGGIYGVRAYPQGEGTGDEGVLVSAELRQDIVAGLQGAAFYDAGRVRFNDHAYAAGATAQTLKGFGVSLSGRAAGFGLKATVAWRDSQAAVTAPDHKPRAWFSAGYSF